MSSQVWLRLLPSTRCLFDEPVQVKVAGLRSRQVVSMRTRSTDEKGVLFISTATYRAERELRWSWTHGSAVVDEGRRLAQKFEKTNSLKSHVVKFSMREGEGRMLAEVISERFLIGEVVSRLPVKEGNFHGVLFTPPSWWLSAFCLHQGLITA